MEKRTHESLYSVSFSLDPVVITKYLAGLTPDKVGDIILAKGNDGNSNLESIVRGGRTDVVSILPSQEAAVKF